MNGRSGCHGWTAKVGFGPEALAVLKIPIASGGTVDTLWYLIWVHPQAHGTTWIPPFKAGLHEDLVQTKAFRRPLDRS